jgi:uncharacterized membrane protein
MSTQPPSAPADTDRNLALVAYGLLAIAVFFAGLPALVAAMIAYSQRRDAPPAIASHYAFQIRIFWVAFAFSLVASTCGIAFLITGIGDLFTFLGSGGWDRLTAGRMTMAEFKVDALPLGLLAAALGLTAVVGAWLIGCSIFGFLRLVNQRDGVQMAA